MCVCDRERERGRLCEKQCVYVNVYLPVLPIHPSFFLLFTSSLGSHQNCTSSQAMVKSGFDYLFDLPSTTTRYLPLCKSPASRSACFDLLIEVCKGNPENYIKLQRLLLSQHRKGERRVGGGLPGLFHLEWPLSFNLIQNLVFDFLCLCV